VGVYGSPTSGSGDNDSVGIFNSREIDMVTTTCEIRDNSSQDGAPTPPQSENSNVSIATHAYKDAVVVGDVQLTELILDHKLKAPGVWRSKFKPLSVFEKLWMRICCVPTSVIEDIEYRRVIVGEVAAEMVYDHDLNTIKYQFTELVKDDNEVADVIPREKLVSSKRLVRRRLRVVTPVVAACINEVRAKYPVMEDNPANRVIISKYLRKRMKDLHFRNCDIASHADTAVELYFFLDPAELLHKGVRRWF